MIIIHFVQIGGGGRVIGGLALVDIVVRAAELVLTTLLALIKQSRCRELLPPSGIRGSNSQGPYVSLVQHFQDS